MALFRACSLRSSTAANERGGLGDGPGCGDNMGKKNSRRVQKLLNSKAAQAAHAELLRLEQQKAASKSAQSTTDFLSDDLKESLGIDTDGTGAAAAATDSVVLTATSSEVKKIKRILQIKRKHEKRANAELDKMTKKKRKKLEKLARKKEKEAKRDVLYAGLRDHSLSDAHHALLSKSTSVGQRKTRKQRLLEHKMRVAAGLETEDADDDEESEDNGTGAVGVAASSDNATPAEGVGAKTSDSTGAPGVFSGPSSLDDMMGSIFSSRRQQAVDTSASGTGGRAGDAKRALNKLKNGPIERRQFGTSLAVPGFLRQFDDDESGGANSNNASKTPEQLQQEEAARAAQEAAIARHKEERALKEADSAKKEASAVKQVIRTVRVLPAFNVAVNRDLKDPVQIARQQLPVCAMEQEIMEAINYNDIVVLCGPTGSGKTTQIPQFLYEAGYGTDPKRPGMIGVTQPRRVAAMSVAKRVAVELGQGFLAGQGGGKRSKRKQSAVNQSSPLGLVAYQVRHDKTTVRTNTKVKFVTEGILLREAEEDILLQKYSVLVLDEVHERNTDTDILLAIVSRIVPLRAKLWQEQQERVNQDPEAAAQHPLANITPLKVIIMSATLNVQTLIHNKQLFGSMSEPPPVIQVCTARRIFALRSKPQLHSMTLV